MSVQRLPSGKWRAQVYSDGRKMGVGHVLGGESTFATKTEARDAQDRARLLLREKSLSGMTVREWADVWLTSSLYRRPKKSTNLHNAERVRRFVEAHGDLRLGQVTDDVVASWIAGGKNLSTVSALRAMFNDAASAKAGRLVDRNPFTGLGLEKGPGRRHEQPPSEAEVWEMVDQARKLTSPFFAAWLQVAAFTGLRPGELDALRWENVNLDTGLITVSEQWSAKARDFTAPKNGKTRMAVITPPAREALISLPRERFVFVTARGDHFRPSSRNYHWDRVRTVMGWLEKDSRKALYLATRHWCGWYQTNVLDLDSEDVAIALGHEDGGELIRRLYGHRETDRALRRIANAYEQAGRVVPLRNRETA